MKKYTVLKVLGFAPGTTLGLSLAQAAVRSHALKTITPAKDEKPGVYETLAPVQFKVGETVYTDAEVNKALADSLELEGATKAKAQDKAKAAAQAKELDALKEKAKAWDDVQPELERLRAATAQFDTKELDQVIAEARRKAALYDALPEAVRAQAEQGAGGAGKGK